MNTFSEHVLERLDSIARSRKLTTMQIDRHPTASISSTPWSRSGDFVVQDREDGWRTVARLRFTFRDGEADSTIDMMGPDGSGLYRADWVAKSFTFRPWHDEEINKMFEYWRAMVNGSMNLVAAAKVAEAANGKGKN